MSLELSICPNCIAPVKPGIDRCEYCGTYFKNKPTVVQSRGNFGQGAYSPSGFFVENEEEEGFKATVASIRNEQTNYVTEEYHDRFTLIIMLWVLFLGVIAWVVLGTPL